MARPPRRDLTTSDVARRLASIERIVGEDGTLDVDATLAPLRAEHDAAIAELRMAISPLRGRIFAHSPFGFGQRSAAERGMRRALDAEMLRARASLTRP